MLDKFRALLSVLRTVRLMARNTGTGRTYEAMIEAALQNRGYTVRTQADAGLKPGGGRHRVDLVAESVSGKALISVKTQNTSGSAEEKTTYEVVKLLEACSTDPDVTHAYLVLGGTGWSAQMIEFLKTRLQDFVPRSSEVRVFASTDEFITHVNLGKLFS